MALIFCSECGKQISSQAAACPHCGHPIQGNQPTPISANYAPVSPVKKTNPYLVYTLPIILVSSLIGILYSLPFIKAFQIERDLENKNTERLVESIDFPSLQSNLKNSFNSMMQKDLQGEFEDNPFGEAGALFAQTLINTMVDSYITPQGLSNLLNESSQEITGFDIASLGYTSLDKFSVKVFNSDNEAATLELSRRGLDWKLTNILLPETVFSDIQESQLSEEDLSSDYIEPEPIPVRNNNTASNRTVRPRQTLANAPVLNINPTRVKFAPGSYCGNYNGAFVGNDVKQQKFVLGLAKGQQFTVDLSGSSYDEVAIVSSVRGPSGEIYPSFFDDVNNIYTYDNLPSNGDYYIQVATVYSQDHVEFCAY